MDRVVSTAQAPSGLRHRRLLVLAAACVVAVALFGGIAAGAPAKTRATTVTITVNTLPISNGLPLDLGIKKGYFTEQGIEIKKVVLQSGNDIVLALANNNGEIGYIGWVPAMIGRTQGIPITAVVASDSEATSNADNWQNILVKGSSAIRAPADLAGKTIAVNALKGVGEVMIRAALKKSGVDPNSIKLLAMPFPTMRTALNNGQVDAIWTPEPFMSQALNIDGARIVLAPGPVLGRYWPIGLYAARSDWVKANADLATRFRTAMNKSLTYAQGNPAEIRALLPAATQNIRLAIWSPLIDRGKLLELAKYTKEYGVITTLPNFTQLVPASIEGGKILQGTVGGAFITLRQDGALVTRLKAGKYTFVVTDNSKTHNFLLVGPGVNRKTTLAGTGRSTWPVTLRKGTYRYSSSARPGQKRTIVVT
jgi:NitT/TauT family transport system substrate-binding protein